MEALVGVFVLILPPIVIVGGLALSDYLKDRFKL